MAIDKAQLYYAVMNDVDGIPLGMIACYEMSDWEDLFGAIKTEQRFAAKLKDRCGDVIRANKWDRQQLETLTAVIHVRAAGMALSDPQARALYVAYQARMIRVLTTQDILHRHACIVRSTQSIRLGAVLKADISAWVRANP